MTAPSPVSQEARDAAADYLRDQGKELAPIALAIREAIRDDEPVVQAFATFEQTIRALCDASQAAPVNADARLLRDALIIRVARKIRNITGGEGFSYEDFCRVEAKIAVDEVLAALSQPTECSPPGETGAAVTALSVNQCGEGEIRPNSSGQTSSSKGSCRRPAEGAVEAMREALEPFAKAADKRQVMCDDAESVTWSAITVGDLRRARAAIRQIDTGSVTGVGR